MKKALSIFMSIMMAMAFTVITVSNPVQVSAASLGGNLYAYADDDDDYDYDYDYDYDDDDYDEDDDYDYDDDSDYDDDEDEDYDDDSDYDEDDDSDYDEDDDDEDYDDDDVDGESATFVIPGYAGNFDPSVETPTIENQTVLVFSNFRLDANGGNFSSMNNETEGSYNIWSYTTDDLDHWNTMPDDSGTSYTPGTAVTVEELQAAGTLYAIWVPENSAASGESDSDSDDDEDIDFEDDSDIDDDDDSDYDDDSDFEDDSDYDDDQDEDADDQDQDADDQDQDADDQDQDADDQDQDADDQDQDADDPDQDEASDNDGADRSNQHRNVTPKGDPADDANQDMDSSDTNQNSNEENTESDNSNSNSNSNNNNNSNTVGAMNNTNTYAPSITWCPPANYNYNTAKVSPTNAPAFRPCGNITKVPEESTAPTTYSTPQTGDESSGELLASLAATAMCVLAALIALIRRVLSNDDVMEY